MKLFRFASILLTCLTISFASFSQEGWNMTYHSNWESATGSYVYNDIWGYADSAGNEYAIIGSSWGTHFVNVTNMDSVWTIQEFAGWNQHPRARWSGSTIVI